MWGRPSLFGQSTPRWASVWDSSVSGNVNELKPQAMSYTGTRKEEHGEEGLGTEGKMGDRVAFFTCSEGLFSKL